MKHWFTIQLILIVLKTFSLVTFGWGVVLIPLWIYLTWNLLIVTLIYIFKKR